MKKLIIAMITFFLVTFSLSTATYAWVAMTRTNVVDDIYLSATLGDDLEISLDGINYYSELPKELLLSYLKAARLTAVTSSDAVNFSHLYGEGVIKNKDYLSLKFYFRTSSRRERDVYLVNNISNELTYQDLNNKEGTYAVSKGIEFKSPFTYLYDIDEYVYEGEVKKYYAHDALRIATIFLEEEREVIKIFDLSNNEHRGYGKVYGAYDYYQKSSGKSLTLPTAIPPTIYELSEFSPNEPFSYDEVSKVMELNEIKVVDEKTYYHGNLTINIWLEGWDADLFDPVIYDRLKIKLQFKAVRSTINS